MHTCTCRHPETRVMAQAQTLMKGPSSQKSRRRIWTRNSMFNTYSTHIHHIFNTYVGMQLHKGHHIVRRHYARTRCAKTTVKQCSGSCCSTVAAACPDAGHGAEVVDTQKNGTYQGQFLHMSEILYVKKTRFLYVCMLTNSKVKCNKLLLCMPMYIFMMI
jgi:hypothetical protein